MSIIFVAHMINIKSSFLSLGDWSLEEYYAKFCGTCEELNACEPISIDIQVMKRQRENLQVARLPYGLYASYDFVRSQILGEQDLPSFSEDFSCLRQAFLSDATSVSQLPSNRSALIIVFSSGGGSFRGFTRGGQEWKPSW